MSSLIRPNGHFDISWIEQKRVEYYQTKPLSNFVFDYRQIHIFLGALANSISDPKEKRIISDQQNILKNRMSLYSKQTDSLFLRVDASIYQKIFGEMKKEKSKLEFDLPPALKIHAGKKTPQLPAIVAYECGFLRKGNSRSLIEQDFREVLSHLSWEQLPKYSTVFTFRPSSMENGISSALLILDPSKQLFPFVHARLSQEELEKDPYPQMHLTSPNKLISLGELEKQLAVLPKSNKVKALQKLHEHPFLTSKVDESLNNNPFCLTYDEEKDLYFIHIRLLTKTLHHYSITCEQDGCLLISGEKYSSVEMFCKLRPMLKEELPIQNTIIFLQNPDYLVEPKNVEDTLKHRCYCITEEGSKYYVHCKTSELCKYEIDIIENGFLNINHSRHASLENFWFYTYLTTHPSFVNSEANIEEHAPCIINEKHRFYSCEKQPLVNLEQTEKFTVITKVLISFREGKLYINGNEYASIEEYWETIHRKITVEPKEKELPQKQKMRIPSLLSLKRKTKHKSNE